MCLFAFCLSAPATVYAADGAPSCGISITLIMLKGGAQPAVPAESSYRSALEFASAMNCSEAFAGMRKSAALGYGPAQNALGELYEAGAAGSPDYNRAAHWYELAANAGDARARYNLGRLIIDERAPAEAATHVAASPGKTATGLSAAQSASSPIWNNGTAAHSAGRERYLAAARLWQISADAGDHLAQYQLGALFAAGMGVPYDLARARDLYRMAAPFVPAAKKALDSLDSGHGL